MRPRVALARRLLAALRRGPAEQPAAPGVDAAALEQLEARLLAALDEQGRLFADRLDVARERLEALIAAPAKPPGQADADPSEDPDAAAIRLLEHLAPLLEDRRALDIGAHAGRYAQALLNAGFAVVCAEPQPELAAALAERLADWPEAVVRPVALDEAPGSVQMFLPESGTTGLDPTLFGTLLERRSAGSMTFAPGPVVEATTIDALRTEQGWPESVGVLKLDVEGAEARVLAGLGRTRPEVLVLEFWGAAHPFSEGVAHPGIEEALRIAQQHSRLPHWLAIVGEGQAVRFSHDLRAVSAQAWGNLVLFARHETFLSAVRWCEARLPQALV